MRKRPGIAIPVIDQDVTNYIRAVRAAGMEPAVLSIWPEQAGQMGQEHTDTPKSRTEAYDGLLLPGGGDILPSRYGQENRGSIAVSEELDSLQFAVLDDFVKAGKPVLGICRGHQVINVYFGGTLIQHLSAAPLHARRQDGRDMAHRCAAEEGSWLEGLYGREFFHNSAHHQGVDIPGKGLIADGCCPEDGTIEAMHHDSLPIYSVQWHPERMCLAFERNDTVNGLPVLEFFRRVCEGNAKEKL